ncbi:transcriptional regulator, MerR family [Sphaerochaeta globosa str. Buddy]|uniref:Transcriptional regulator, MerR family n=2 Tax=Sphaerochaeta TaxID=399320 RepID=F0RUU6_SPHGB|nr:transcriptional regulator, MerR family [Sphaerochaeta globosa str. Buddy]
MHSCGTNACMQQTYRIGELARKCNVTVRTIRYYESLGLLKTNHRSDGGQRYYTDADVVYLNRIAELKDLDFTLSEIRTIVLMGNEDTTGQKRRNELLRQYRSKLSEAMERQAAIEKRVADLSWHIQQLETNDDFQQCPGLMCKSCTFKENCRFREL